jgi:hypothetical protein
VNLQRGTVGKNDVVEGYIRSPRGREIAPEKPPCPFMQGGGGNGGDVSFDRRAFGNRKGGSGVNWLDQLCCNWLAGLGDAQAFFESATKIIPRSNNDRIG